MPMSYTLAEDTAIAKGLDAIGLRTVFAHRPLRQLIGWRTLREVYDRQVRWSVIRHTHEPLTFPLEPLVSPLPAALAAALAAPLLGMPAFAAFGITLTGWFLRPNSVLRGLKAGMSRATRQSRFSGAKCWRSRHGRAPGRRMMSSGRTAVSTFSSAPARRVPQHLRYRPRHPRGSARMQLL